MKKLAILTFLVFIFFAAINCGQNFADKYSEYGTLTFYDLSYTAFPEALRDSGYTYKGTHYSKEKHYSNSSTAVFIPKNFKQKDSVNFVYYFHGWWNNIKKSISTFEIIEQFAQSDMNAILILPETAFDAPDSYGGNLEKKLFFHKQLEEIIEKLENDNHITNTKIGDLVLAGHSGAYRVIAHILERGGLSKQIKEVYLFDALYSETDKYLNWIKTGGKRFINIYTDDGDTKTRSEEMMRFLQSDGIVFGFVKEKELVDSMFIYYNILFVHTDLSHSGVISRRSQLYNYLSTSQIEDSYKLKDKKAAPQK